MTTLEFDDDDRAIPKGTAERGLLEVVKVGKAAFIEGNRSPTKPEDWGPDHTIRADYLRHICLHPDLYDVAPTGIHIERAFVSGELDLAFATLSRQLWIKHSRFEQVPNFNYAILPILNIVHSYLPGLYANGAKIKGHCSLGHSTFTGEVRLTSAEIGGYLNCEHAAFENDDGKAITAERMRVTGSLSIRKMRHNPIGTINLGYAAVGQLFDDDTSWPKTDRVVLEGFTYESLPYIGSVKKRCEWLENQPLNKPDKTPAYWPQPYEQLVEVLKRSGHDRDARLISIAKQAALYEYLGRLGGFRNKLKQAWMTVLNVTAGYGYKPMRALWIGLGIMAFGALSFESGYNSQLVMPSQERVYTNPCFLKLADSACDPAWEKPELQRFYQPTWLLGKAEYRLPKDYTPFHPLAYSIDVFIPILDLKQEVYWQPKSKALRWYMWFHIVSGWVLTTIAVAGFAGYVKKD